MTDQVKSTIDAKKNTVETLMYPLDLGSIGLPHVTQFNIYRYAKNTMFKFEIKEQQAIIRLPIAQKLSTGDMMEYEEFSATMLANLMTNFTAGGLKDTAHALGVAVTGAVSNAMGDDAKLIGSQLGVTINPRIANVFKTPRPRDLQFEYSFVARNEKESDEINKIINLFRYYAHPSNADTSGSLFLVPEIFVIRHLSVIDSQYIENPYLPKPLPAALVAVNVDENPTGEAAFFKDTFAPVERRVTLMFKEMEVDTKETLRERYK